MHRCIIVLNIINAIIKTLAYMLIIDTCLRVILEVNLLKSASYRGIFFLKFFNYNINVLFLFHTLKFKIIKQSIKKDFIKTIATVMIQII